MSDVSMHALGNCYEAFMYKSMFAISRSYQILFQPS